MGTDRDSDDFLGWAPDFGLWDAPTEPSPAMTPTPLSPLLADPTPVPQRGTPTPAPRQAPPASQGAVARPPTASSPRPQSTGRQLQRPSVARSAAFVIMLFATMWNALLMTGDGTRASPVALAGCGVVTAVLGTLVWGRGRR